MEPLIEGTAAAQVEQLRGVHRLTVALHQADSAGAFYAEAMDTIVTTLGADRASLLMFEPDGVMRFKAWRGLSSGYRQAVEGHTPWSPDDADAAPILVPDVEADPGLAELLPVLRAEGIAALAFVPLVHRGRVLGKFMTYYDRPHSFPEPEVTVAEILAGHVALAAERQRTQEGLRAAAERLASLQKVTAELSRAVGVADVADVVLGVALAELGACSGSLCMIEGEELRMAAAVGYPPEVLAYWSRFPLFAELPPCDAVRSGRAVFLPSPRDRTERYPGLAGTPTVGDGAYAVVPLGEEIPLGALVIGFAEPRAFGAEDESFLKTLAGQCAAAIGRAQLYEERERARVAAVAGRARLAFLAEASTALASSLDYRATLLRVAELAVPLLADLCAVYLLDEGHVRVVALAHVDPDAARAARLLTERYPATLGDLTGVGAVLRSGIAARYRAVTDEQLAAAARDDEHLALMRAAGVRAAAVIPMAARGRVIGALVLGAGPDRDVDDDAVALGENLAGRAGAAIDNARLFAARTATARTLQASLLPPELPAIAGLEVAARYLAGREGVDVGGDFYDLFPLYGHRHLLLLGDVCGRGVEAATTALLIRHVTRSAAVNLRSPAAVLAHLNDVLLRQAGNPHGEPRFATAVVAVVHPRADGTVAVTLASGGHPLPMLRSADGGVRPVGVAGSLLGVTEQAGFTDRGVLLGPGDALVCYTDGVTERRTGSAFFGEDGLAATLGAASGGAAALATALQAAVTGFAETEPHDDLALLVLTPA